MASPIRVPVDDPRARRLIAAIRGGDLEALRRELASDPELATSRIVAPNGERTLLHIATDWPGHPPRVGETIHALLAGGAAVDAPFVGKHAETALHWAASCNDLDAIEALLAGGAAIDARGGVIAGGTPLDDAVAFGQWRAAHRLVEAGAQTTLWTAAGLGHVERVEALLSRSSLTDLAPITGAFWCACHGGQRATAELLRSYGAELDWVGYGDQTPLDAAIAHGGADELVGWLRSLGAHTAAELR